MATQLKSAFLEQYSDANGLLVGGSITFYQAGSTTTKQAIYADAGEVTQLSNPQTLGNIGELQNVVYLDGDYNIVIKDRNGVTVHTRDNFDQTDASSTVLEWMLDAQASESVIGRWTTVDGTAGITLVGGDTVMGDTTTTGTSFYQLLAAGDPAINPESDTYNENTGIGTHWIDLTIAAAPIHQSDLDVLQTEIDALEDSINLRGNIEISNNSVDPTNDIDFTAGTIIDDTRANRINATSAFTKRIDAVWASGTNAGGRPNGLTLSNGQTWYVFALGDASDTAAFDFGFDTDISATNLLGDSAVQAENLDIAGIVGAIKYGSVNDTNLQNAIVPFDKYGDTYYFTRIAESDNTTNGYPTTRTAYDTDGIPDYPVLIGVSADPDAGTQSEEYGIVTNLDGTDQTPSASLYELHTYVDIGGDSSAANVQKTMKCDGSSQIGVRFDAIGTNTATIYINTYGYIFPIDRN